MIRVVPALIIFGKMHFLVIHEIKRDGITSLHEIHDEMMEMEPYNVTLIHICDSTVVSMHQRKSIHMCELNELIQSWLRIIKCVLIQIKV